MTIIQLKYFLAAAQYLNFSKAAEALFIHPATMSRCIASMEVELGTPLFNRMKYSLQLTEVGSRFRIEADEIVEKYEHMISEAKASAENIHGSLSLLTPQIYYQMLADAYQSFSVKNPQVDFSVDVCPFSKLDTVCQAVENGEIDLGITFSINYHNAAGKLECLNFYEEEQVLTLPLDHPLAAQTHCRLSDLQDTPLLLADHQGKDFLRKVSHALNQKDNNIQIMHSSSGETLLLRFTAGLGATLMPSIIAHNSNGNFAVLKLDDLDTKIGTLLVWRREHENPAVDAFVDCVRKCHPTLHPISISKNKEMPASP